METYKSSDLVSIKHRGYAVDSVILSDCVIIPAARLKQQKGFCGGILDKYGNEVLMARLTRSKNDKKLIMGLKLCEGLMNNAKHIVVGYGDYQYGGAYSWHYGHFLLEGLSRLPLAGNDRRGSKFIYHDVTNGVYSPHIEFFLRALEVTAFPVTVPTRMIGELRMISPKVKLHSYFMQEQSAIYQQISEYVLKTYYTPDKKTSKMVYLSRSKLGKDKRKLANESELEVYLSGSGVEVIHMQDLSLDEQIITMAKADVVLGPIGSAMHNTVFCKPGTKIIYLCEKINDNFPLCDIMMGHEALYAVSECKADGPWSVDIQKITNLL